MKRHYIIHYLEHRPAFFAFIRSLEAMLFEQHKHHIKDPILDFGCGDGFFAEMVWDTDVIDVGLDVTKSRTHDIGKKTIYKRVVTYDGHRIPFPDNHFGSVISNCVLEHIPNLDESVGEIYRVLKPGGYFVTSVMAKQWENYLAGTTIFGLWYQDFMRKKQVHHNLFTREQWSNTFEKQGFDITSIAGYMSRDTAFWMDVFHYLSFPSLISYTVVKRWVLAPQLHTHPWIVRFINNHTTFVKDLNKAAGLFYVVQKPPSL